jgi:hypothetical protein
VTSPEPFGQTILISASCGPCGRPLRKAWMLVWRPKQGIYDGVCDTCAGVMLDWAEKWGKLLSDDPPSFRVEIERN